MSRLTLRPRADWRPGLARLPFGVGAMAAGLRWREDRHHEFSAHQIDLIESVADEVYAMALDATRVAIDGEHLAAFGFDQRAARLIEASWRPHWSAGAFTDVEGPLVGRLTFAHDGRDRLKLLAIDLDQPRGLFAAAVIQANWRDAIRPGAPQFNTLHDALVERWEALAAVAGGRAPPRLASADPHDPESAAELAYLAATAADAGIGAGLTSLSAMGWDGSRLIDGDGAVVRWLRVAGGWSAIMATALADHLGRGDIRVVEPAWTALTSNHGLLALLSHRHPGHPHLCRADTEAPADGGGEWIERAFQGGEAAVSRVWRDGAVVWSSQGDAACVEAAPIVARVWLEMPPIRRFDGVTSVIDAWMVGGKCLGMSVREDDGLMIGPDAVIVPHTYVNGL